MLNVSVNTIGSRMQSAEGLGDAQKTLLDGPAFTQVYCTKLSDILRVQVSSDFSSSSVMEKELNFRSVSVLSVATVSIVSQL